MSIYGNNQKRAVGSFLISLKNPVLGMSLAAFLKL